MSPCQSTMPSFHRAPPHVAAMVAFVLASLAPPAGADEGDRAWQTPLSPAYRQECSACHIAYPPGLLPAPSWHRLMGDLRHHFGTDASLDAASTLDLTRWLEARAATRGPLVQPPPQDRITRSAWFVDEHDEVPPDAWKRPDVKSAANCAACHTKAEQGDFRERHIRIPR